MNGECRPLIGVLSKDGTVFFWKSVEAFVAVALYIK